MTESELIRRTCRLLPCDVARVVRFPERMFLVCGWNRRSEGQWVNQDGEPQDFDYLEEKCLARGRTLEELWYSIKHYKRLTRLDRIKDPVKRVKKMLELA